MESHLKLIDALVQKTPVEIAIPLLETLSKWIPSIPEIYPSYFKELSLLKHALPYLQRIRKDKKPTDTDLGNDITSDDINQNWGRLLYLPRFQDHYMDCRAKSTKNPIEAMQKAFPPGKNKAWGIDKSGRLILMILAVYSRIHAKNPPEDRFLTEEKRERRDKKKSLFVFYTRYTFSSDINDNTRNQDPCWQFYSKDFFRSTSHDFGFDIFWKPDSLYMPILFKSLCNGRTMASALMLGPENSFPKEIKDKICPPWFRTYFPGSRWYTKPYFFAENSDFSYEDASLVHFQALIMDETSKTTPEPTEMQLAEEEHDLHKQLIKHLYFVCYLKAL